jgi:hypothetical protein
VQCFTCHAHISSIYSYAAASCIGTIGSEIALALEDEQVHALASLFCSQQSNNPAKLVMIVSQHNCETVMCNIGAPLSVSLLPSIEGCILCCWHDGLIAAYKRNQLFVLSLWSLQLPHRIAHMCVDDRHGIIIATTVGGQCSLISAADGLVVRAFSIGPIVVMSMFIVGDSSLMPPCACWQVKCATKMIVQS